MSADNGIYIGHFPDGYRVIHAQAIENCDDHKEFPQELTDASRVVYYGKSPLFVSRDEVWNEARRIYDSMRADDNADGWLPFVLEYGISEIKYDRPLPAMSYKQAQEYIEEFWGAKRSGSN